MCVCVCVCVCVCTRACVGTCDQPVVLSFTEHVFAELLQISVGLCIGYGVKFREPKYFFLLANLLCELTNVLRCEPSPHSYALALPLYFLNVFTLITINLPFTLTPLYSLFCSSLYSLLLLYLPLFASFLFPYLSPSSPSLPPPSSPPPHPPSSPPPPPLPPPSSSSPSSELRSDCPVPLLVLPWHHGPRAHMVHSPAVFLPILPVHHDRHLCCLRSNLCQPT